MSSGSKESSDASNDLSDSSSGRPSGSKLQKRGAGHDSMEKSKFHFQKGSQLVRSANNFYGAFYGHFLLVIIYEMPLRIPMPNFSPGLFSACFHVRSSHMDYIAEQGVPRLGCASCHYKASSAQGRQTNGAPREAARYLFSDKPSSLSNASGSISRRALDIHVAAFLRGPRWTEDFSSASPTVSPLTASSVVVTTPGQNPKLTLCGRSENPAQPWEKAQKSERRDRRSF